MNKPTIIILNDSPKVNGGTAKVALLEAELLIKYGYKVKLFTAGYKDSDFHTKNKYEHIATNQKDVYNEPNKLVSSVRGLWNFKAAKQLSKILNENQSSNTIIHLYGWTKALSSSIIRVAKRKNIVVICSLFDYFVACPNGGFFNYPKNAICTLRPLSLKCIITNCDSKSYLHKLWRVIRHWIQRYVGGIPNDVLQYVGCSKLSVALLSPYLPGNSVVNFIRNPITTEKNSCVNVDKNKYYIYVGRLSKEKGPLLFAEAANMAGIKAIFVGDGPCRQEIENNYPDILITGGLPPDEVSKYLKKARAIIFPSVWREPQGLVILEAAAMGVPAIVSNLSAAIEFVQNEKSGLWFQSGNVFDLAEKITKLESDKFLSELGINAYNDYWLNPSGTEDYVCGLDKLYRSILLENDLNSKL
jgi:glycosyltransferase involved in cell wall biosynthesis